MKNRVVLFFALCILMSSCALTSTTYIKPMDTFLLGQNEHGSFTVNVKNISEGNIDIWRIPNAGGKHSPIILKPQSTAKIKVESNTAVSFANNTKNEATIELKVTGDIGVSMGYKNN